MNKDKVDKQKEEGKKKANREEQNKTIGERGVRCRRRGRGANRRRGIELGDEVVARQAVRPGEREKGENGWTMG
jgi:hypothetical protein